MRGGYESAFRGGRRIYEQAGVVIVSRISTADGATVRGLERPDFLFGVTRVLGDARRRESAVTLYSCEVMEWPRAELDTLMVRTPALGRALVRIVARKLVEAREHIDPCALQGELQRSRDPAAQA